jgi:hypothetical protein
MIASKSFIVSDDNFLIIMFVIMITMVMIIPRTPLTGSSQLNVDMYQPCKRGAGK